MNILAAFLLASMLQGGPPDPRLNHNSQALVGLDKVVLAVTTSDFGPPGNRQTRYARELLEPLRREALDRLVSKGVPVVSDHFPQHGSALLLEMEIYGHQEHEGETFLPFRVSLSLIDDVTMTRNGESMRAVVWREENPFLVAREGALELGVIDTVDRLCSRFAETYRIANGIR